MCACVCECVCVCVRGVAVAGEEKFAYSFAYLNGPREMG